MPLKQQYVLRWVVGIVLLLGLAMLARIPTEQNPPPAKDYYDGPMVNKRGDLVDGKTGKVLQRGYSKPQDSQKFN